MLAGERGHALVETIGGPHACVPVGGDRHPDPRSADQDPARGLAALDRLGQPVRVIGVVDAVRRIGAEVHRLVAEVGEVAGQILLELVAGVIRREQDSAGTHARSATGCGRSTFCSLALRIRSRASRSAARYVGVASSSAMS